MYEQVRSGVLKSYVYDGAGYLRQFKEINMEDMNGKGRHYYEDGRFYEGEMKNNMPHGNGVMKDRYGDVF